MGKATGGQEARAASMANAAVGGGGAGGAGPAIAVFRQAAHELARTRGHWIWHIINQGSWFGGGGRGMRMVERGGPRSWRDAEQMVAAQTDEEGLDGVFDGRNEEYTWRAIR